MTCIYKCLVPFGVGNFGVRLELFLFLVLVVVVLNAVSHCHGIKDVIATRN